jgi:hypothetical protein
MKLLAVNGNYHHAPSQEQTRREKTEAGKTLPLAFPL